MRCLAVGGGLKCRGRMGQVFHFLHPNVGEFERLCRNQEEELDLSKRKTLRRDLRGGGCL